jgi:hypothetical protein
MMEHWVDIDAVQWPAMVATLAAAWFVASTKQHRRRWGFWVFVLSNLLWIVWGWHAEAYGLIALQVGLFVMNVRGIERNPPGPCHEPRC